MKSWIQMLFGAVVGYAIWRPLSIEFPEQTLAEVLWIAALTIVLSIPVLVSLTALIAWLAGWNPPHSAKNNKRQ